MSGDGKSTAVNGLTYINISKLYLVDGVSGYSKWQIGSKGKRRKKRRRKTDWIKLALRQNSLVLVSSLKVTKRFHYSEKKTTGLGSTSCI